MQPLLIGPLTLGVQQNVKPFMIPDVAWANMLNAYVWRQQARRKAGFVLLGRLRRVLNSASLGVGTISAGGAGVVTFNLFTLMGLNVISPNAQFDLGSAATPLIIAIGAPINQILTDSTGAGTFVIAGAGPITAASINYATGVLSLTFSGAAGASDATITGAYFPTLPAMGIRYYDDPTVVNQEKTIFFDTIYAYRFSAGFFEELPSTLSATWSGTDAQQFWSTVYQGTRQGPPLFWVTNGKATVNGFSVTAMAAGPPKTATTATTNNFAVNDIVVFDQMTAGIASGSLATVTNVGPPFQFTSAAAVTTTATTGMVYNTTSTDGLRYYDGTTWHYFTPITDGGSAAPTSYVLGCLLIVPYKGRLVILNTTEGVTGSSNNFRQRARWCQIGDPTDPVQGWRSDIPGFGGFDDAATDESIISCGFVKDELIVYFEKSTWKLVYSGNEIQPFIWQRINSELGAESSFSAVQFDAGLVALGNVGIHTCNGSQVQRIDEVIPDEIFDMHNGSDGPLRSSGLRDFYQEIVYFAYASDERNTTAVGKTFFPNKMIVYNYRNNTFSFLDDQATCFGYYQRPADFTWAQLNKFTWSAWNIPWNSGVVKSGFPAVNFGNQQGFIETILPFQSSGDSSLTIKNIVGNTITSPQHNLFQGQYVTIRFAVGVTGVNFTTFQITQVIDENTFTIDGTAVGTYVGGGLLYVAQPIELATKQFTPYWERGKNYTLKYFDVLVDRTAVGELQVDVYIDFDTTQSMTDTSSGVVLGSSTLSTAPEGSTLPYYRFQIKQGQIWKRFYTVATGETFQIKFSFNDAEMRSGTINESDVVIHAMVMFFEPAGEFY